MSLKQVSLCGEDLKGNALASMCHTGCKGCVFNWSTLISVEACMMANRRLVSASLSFHKLLFILLRYFKRVVCNSVKNRAHSLHSSDVSSLQT